jgi:CRP/FNR family transcriptional regulator, cyclic AMP receptor protein
MRRPLAPHPGNSNSHGVCAEHAARRAVVFPAVKRASFADGDVIFREGEPSDAAYLVISGFVQIVSGYGSPHQRTLGTLGKGQYFGEMGAIDNSPRSATAVAKGEMDCVSVGQDEFMETLIRQPTEAIALLKVLFERLRRADRNMS